MTVSETVTTETAHLVSMANDIAANLGFHADADERIAEHINRFWAPRMRGLLLEYAAGGGQGLSDNLLPALSKLRE
jgi:formate dehydrogenase subunit delta